MDLVLVKYDFCFSRLLFRFQVSRAMVFLFKHEILVTVQDLQITVSLFIIMNKMSKIFRISSNA